MKLLCRFVIFAATVAACTCSSSLTRLMKHSKDEYFCDFDMIVPEYAVHHCKLESEKTVNSYIAKLVDETIDAVHQNCTQHSEQICNGLPELHKKQNHGTHQDCKENVADIICEYPITHEHGLGQKIYRSYLKSVFEMIIMFETKKSDITPGKEAEMCVLFQQNEFLIDLIKGLKCKTLQDDIITKTTCNKIMRSF